MTITLAKVCKWQFYSVRLIPTIKDINECLESNGGCEDSCTNTVGSYTCSCQASGYALSSDKHNCSGKLIFAIFKYTLI